MYISDIEILNNIKQYSDIVSFVFPLRMLVFHVVLITYLVDYNTFDSFKQR